MPPQTWAEVEHRLAEAFGGGRAARAEAREWVREAVEAEWGTDLRGLDRRRRQVALQRCTAVLWRLQELGGDLSFDPDLRAVVAAAFAPSWGGAALDGPPWRLSPRELDRPLYADWAALARFGAADDEGPPVTPKARRAHEAPGAEEYVEEAPYWFDPFAPASDAPSASEPHAP